MTTGARAVRFARSLRARWFAIRLARRRETGSRDGWRGLALRWRHPARPKGAAALNSRTAPAAPVVSWSPHFHLHLATEARPAAPAALVFVRPAQVMRDTHHRVQALFRTVYRTDRVAGPLQWLDRIRDAAPVAVLGTTEPVLLLQRSASRRRRGARYVVGSVHRLERLARPAAPPVSTVGAAAPQLFRPPSARRPDQWSMHPLAPGSRARRLATANGTMTPRRPFRATPVVHAAGTSESRQPVTTQIRLRTRQPHLLIAQQLATIARTVDHVYKPIDIVWSRRRSAAGTTAEFESDGRSSRATTWTAPAHPVPTERWPPVSSQPTPSPGSLKLADIDPRLLDRLTDNVIRRVERHVRIERERRGL